MKIPQFTIINSLKFFILVSILVFALSGCKKTSIDYGFTVKGTSGNDVLLDKTWYRDCTQGPYGEWTHSMRTLSDNELSTTISEYQNGSASSDCMNGYASVVTFVQTLTLDNIMVPITWIDETGQTAAAPDGLEGVTEANGASGLVTYAVMTPVTQTKADQLNMVSYAGISDWAPGVTRDILSSFSVNPAKGCVIVDDRTSTGAVYDGYSTDPTKYPTLMPNANPHTGPLSTVSFN